MLRTLWVLAYGVVLTAVYATRAILGGLLRPDGASCTCDRLARIWGERIVRASGSTIEVEGAGHIDPAQPHILIANHESWFDVFAVLGHVPGRFRFVAKKELARIPIFGQAWRMCGHISVDRSDRSSAVQSLQQAAGRIREDGLTIVLFPEGTRSATGHLLPFKKGAFVLAIQSRVPLVPVAVAGTRQIMPKGSFRIRPGHIRIKVGAPIETAGLTHEDRDALLQRSHDAIAELKRSIGGVPDGEPPAARAGDDRS